MNTAPEDDTLLAAEYVLGALDWPERLAVQARLAAGDALCQEVALWEERFAPLLEGYSPVDPSPQTWRRIAARLGWADPHRRAWWSSLPLWRATAAVAVVAAVLVGTVRPPLSAPDQPSVEPALSLRTVSPLLHTDGTPLFVASLDPRRDRLEVTPLPAQLDPQGRVPELWLIPPGGSPQSLGVISATHAHAVDIPARLRTQLVRGAVFAVSLEPVGGAPAGSPTGPVVATGAVHGT